jgi:hypothetical protein
MGGYISGSYSRNNGILFLILSLLCIFAMAMGQLFPAVVSRPGPESAVGSFKAQTVASAILEYRNQFGNFPELSHPNLPDRLGVSWRVAILPMLDQEELFALADMRQAWDTDVNKYVGEHAMVSYRWIGCRDVVGGDFVALTLNGRTWACDSESNRETEAVYTVMFVVVPGVIRHASEPRDIDIDEFRRRYHMGLFKDRHVYVARVDGRVDTIPPHLSDDALIAELAR